MSNDLKPQQPSATTVGYKPMQPHPVKQRALCILHGTPTFEDRYVPDHDELIALVNELRDLGCKVVLTLGVWDLIHEGHADYINAGKREAQKLYPGDRIIAVVGFDTDELTKRRKGPQRPIVPETERAHMLAYTRPVDIVTPQREPNQLYKLVPHDVRIISTSTKDLPPDHEDMKAQCEHLINLPPQSETSTTERIRKLATEGKLEALERVRDKLSRTLEELTDELSH